MNTYKVLEKPSGLFGLRFEDMAVLMAVIFLSLFPINLLKVWVELPKWITLVAYGLILLTFIFLRRANQKKVPGFLFSWFAYHFLTPRHISVHHSLDIFNHAVYQKKEKQGPGRSHSYSHHRK